MSKKVPDNPTEFSSLESPTQDHTARFSLDRKIRNKGWKIALRPKGGQPMWVKDGKMMRQDELCELEGIW